MWRSKRARQIRWVMALSLAAAVVVNPAAMTAFQAPRESEGSTGRQQMLGTHATRGIVRAIDAKKVEIERSRQRGIMTFNLTSSTHWEGVIVVGSAVSVRYHEVGKDHVATAIAVQRPKD